MATNFYDSLGLFDIGGGVNQLQMGYTDNPMGGLTGVDQGGTFSVLPNYTNSKGQSVSGVADVMANGLGEGLYRLPNGQITSTPSPNAVPLPKYYGGDQGAIGAAMQGAGFGNQLSGNYSPSSPFSYNASSGGGGQGGAQQGAGGNLSGNYAPTQPFSYNQGGGGTSGGSVAIDPNAANPQIYAPSPAAYNQAMQAELASLYGGAEGAIGELRSGINFAEQNQAAGLNDITGALGPAYASLEQKGSQAQGALGNALTGGQQALAGAYNPVLGQYQGITAGAAGDVNYLRNMTQGGVDQQFANYMNSPAFQFGLNNAMSAIQNSAAAEGMLRSGATLKALGDRASDYTSQQYNQFRSNELGAAQNLANTTLGALGQQGALAQGYGNQAASLYGNIGQAQAQNYSTTGQNLANAGLTGAGLQAQQRLGTTGAVLGAFGDLAQVRGELGSAEADARSRGILGKGTRSITLNV